MEAFGELLAAALRPFEEEAQAANRAMAAALAEQGKAVCGALVSSCICGEPPGHEPPHECLDQVTCWGAWTGSEEGSDFAVVRWPTAGEA